MPEGPIYTKNNYRTVDQGIPYLIKSAYKTNYIAGPITAGTFNPSLIFNIPANTVKPDGVHADLISIYLENQTKYVIPLVMIGVINDSSGTANTTITTSAWGAMNNSLQSLGAASMGAALKALAGAGDISLANPPMVDFNTTDFINPMTLDASNNPGVIFPFTFSEDSIAVPPNASASVGGWYPSTQSIVTTGNLTSYLLCLYAELQQ